MVHPDTPPEVRRLQDAIWREMSPERKLDLVGRFWLQARAWKRAALRQAHPDWDDARLDRAARDAMHG